MGVVESAPMGGVLEALSLPFAPLDRLVRVLGPVVQALVLSVLPAHGPLPLGRGMGLQVVGDQHTRRSLTGRGW